MKTHRFFSAEPVGAFVVGILALVLYGANVSGVAAWGGSALLMAEYSGVYPQTTPFRPLWGWLVRLVGPDVWRLNAMSAVFAALCLGLLFSLMYRWLRQARHKAQPDTEHGRGAGAMAVAGAAAATLYLGASAPFQIAAVQASSATFDVFLLLAAFRLYQAFTESERFGWGLAMAFLCGLGCVQLPSFFLFSVILILGALLALVRQERLTWWRALLFGAAGLAGLLFYWPAIVEFTTGATAGRLVSGTAWEELLFWWRLQFRQILYGHPWLLIVAFFGLPWFGALGLATRGLGGSRDVGLILAHTLFGAIVIALFFNEPFAVWNTLSAHGLVVTPYALAAMVFGYVLVYAVALPSAFAGAQSGVARHRTAAALGAILGALLIVPLLLGTPENVRARATAEHRAIDRYARAMLDAAPETELLLTDGLMDSNLRLIARERGYTTIVAALPMLQTEEHRRYLAARLLPNEEAAGLAFLGWDSFVYGHFMKSDLYRRTLADALPDFWVSIGTTPAPEGLAYRGIAPGASPDAEARFERYLPLWSELADEFAAIREQGYRTPLPPLLKKRLGALATNMGVLLLQTNDIERAGRSFALARRISPDNISALLNLDIAVAAGYRGDGAEQLAEDSKRTLDALEGQPLRDSTALIASGYIHHWHAYLQQARFWMRHGRIRTALMLLEQSALLAPSEERFGLLLETARTLKSAHSPTQALEAYRVLSERAPTNVMILAEAADTAIEAGDMDTARALIDRFAELAGDSPMIDVFEARLLEGNRDAQGSEKRLAATLERAPAFEPAWQALVELQSRSGDLDGLRTSVRAMETRGLHHYEAYLQAKGYIDLTAGDATGARRYLVELNKRHPQDPRYIELLMGIALQLDQRLTAEEHARALLALNPNHPAANHTLGILLAEREEMLAAETALRIAMSQTPNPVFANSLAWVLHLRGALDEAETLIRGALAEHDQAPPFWNTLGAIRLKRGDRAEARNAFEQALKLNAAEISPRLHLAELDLSEDLRSDAAARLKTLALEQGRMSPKQRATWQQLNRRAAN